METGCNEVPGLEYMKTYKHSQFVTDGYGTVRKYSYWSGVQGFYIVTLFWICAWDL